MFMFSFIFVIMCALFEWKRICEFWFVYLFISLRDHRGRDHMVVGFITTYAISAYISPPTLWVRILHRWGVLDTTLCDIVCQRLATGRGFLWVLRFPPPKKNWPTRYNWNIVESGIKHHKPNPYLYLYCCCRSNYHERTVGIPLYKSV